MDAIKSAITLESAVQGQYIHPLQYVLATVIDNSVCLPEKVASCFTVASARILKQATIFILIGKNEATALMDTGSSGSFISYDYTNNIIKK